MIVVGDEFNVGAHERGKRLDFRLPEALMDLSESNQIQLHLETP